MGFFIYSSLVLHLCVHTYELIIFILFQGESGERGDRGFDGIAGVMVNILQ